METRDTIKKCNNCKYAKRADAWNIYCCREEHHQLYGRNYSGCKYFEERAKKGARA